MTQAAVGDIAPDIDLPTVERRRWRLAEQRARAVVLIFHRHLH